MGHFALLFYTLALAVPFAAWRAWVAVVLWGWFITPVTGIGSPGLWVMAGIMLIAALFTPLRLDEHGEKTPFEIGAENTVKGVFAPLMALAFGALFAAFAGVL